MTDNENNEMTPAEDTVETPETAAAEAAVSEEHSDSHAEEHGHGGPTGDEAYEPDRTPMGVLMVTLVGLVVFMILSGVVLYEWMAVAKYDREQAVQTAANPALKALRDEQQASLQSYGFDEQSGLYRIPLATAFGRLLENPANTSCVHWWPELTPAAKPEAEETGAP